MSYATLTAKQARYTLNLFKGMNQRAAYIDAYHCNYALTTVDANASRLAHNAKVMAYLEQLQAEAHTAAVMDKQERLERLSEIGRAKLPDFVDDKGNVNLTAANSAALSEVSIEQWRPINKESFIESRVIKVKLRDPVSGIQELNKMDHIYEPDKGGDTTNNTQVNFFVMNDKAKDLAEKVTQRLLSGNDND